MSKFIAIDADAHGLIVAVGSATRDKLIVDRLIAATDLAQPISATTATIIGERLKQLLKDVKIGNYPVLVALGRDRVILKDIKHPPVPPADEPGVVRFQVIKEMGDGADDIIIDYQPLPSTGVERRAAVACLKADTLAAIRKVCDTAGLKIAAITPRPFAAVALLQRAATDGVVPPPDPADGPVAVVMVTEAGGEFTVCRNGIVTFTRNLPPTILGSETTLLAEIRRNLAVAAGQVGNDVQAIYVAEGETQGEGWSGRLRAALGLPVYTFDPLAGIPGGNPIPAELHGRFLGPIGLLVARGAAGPLPINFAMPRQPRRGTESTPQKRRLMIAGLAAAGLFGLLGLGGYLLNDMAEAKVIALRKQIADTEEDTKKAELNAKRLAAVDEFVSREVVWLDELYEQAEIVPDIRRIRMMEWEGKTVPMPTDKERAAAAAAPPNKNAPPKKVALLTMKLSSDSPDMIEKQVAAIDRDKRFYVGTTKKLLPLMSGAAGKNVQQFVIETGLADRKPGDYTRRLTASMPKLPEPVEEKKPETGPVTAPAEDVIDEVMK